LTTTPEEILRDVREGMVPANIYADPEIFQLERERYFARNWVFLAHESEIPANGDYVVRQIVADSFIVSRDEHGEVHVIFNMCLHRGMQVCRSERGNSSHFRCPYHAWTYKNSGELVGVPFHADAYGGDEGLSRGDTKLIEPGRVGIYNGLIFANLDPDAEDLEDYLDGYQYYLDFYTKQSEAGCEFRGPQRWRVKTNWKIGSENFSGDSYHTPYTHSSVVEIGLFGEPKASKRKQGAVYQAGPAGGTTYKLPGGSFEEMMAFVGYPEEMIERMAATWSPAQKELISNSGFMPSATGLQPNLAGVHNWPQIDETERVVPFLTIRQWQPISVTETEIQSWFVVDKLAPESFKKDSYKAYLMCFGSSGMFEQDDVENWTSITHVSGGEMAKTLRLNSRMGLGPDGKTVKDPISPWPAPGTGYRGFGEYGQRELLERWAQMLCEEPAPRERRSSIGGNSASPGKEPADVA